MRVGSVLQNLADGANPLEFRRKVLAPSSLLLLGPRSRHLAVLGSGLLATLEAPYHSSRWSERRRSRMAAALPRLYAYDLAAASLSGGGRMGRRCSLDSTRGKAAGPSGGGRTVRQVAP
jgi:hypothetical protein